MAIYSAQSTAVMGKTGATQGPAKIGDNGLAPLAVTKGIHHDKVVATFDEVAGGIIYEIWSRADDNYSSPAVKLGEINGTGVAGTPVSIDITEDGSGDLQDTGLTAPEYFPPSNIFATNGEHETKIVITYAQGYVEPGARRYYWVVAKNAAGGLSADSDEDYGYRHDGRANEEVHVSDSDQGPFSLLNDSASSPFEHTGLSATTTKYYKLRLEASSGEFSDFTDVVTGATGGAGATAPDPPTNVSATKGDHHSKVTLTWTKSAGATAYEIWSGLTDGSAPSKIKDIGDVATADITSVDDPLLTSPSLTAPTSGQATQGAYKDRIELQWTDGILTQGATRRFYVKAVNAGGPSALSNFSDGYRGGTLKGVEIQRSPNGEFGDYTELTDSESSPFTHLEIAAGTEIWYKLRMETTNGLFSVESASFRGDTAAEGAGLYSAPVSGWTSPPEPHKLWAFDIADQSWRQPDTEKKIAFFINGTDSELWAFDDGTKLINSFNSKEPAAISARTKTFVVGVNRKEVVRYLTATYRSEVDFYVDLYAENNPVPIMTILLPRQVIEDTFSKYIGLRAEKFAARVYGASDTLTLLTFNSLIFADEVEDGR